MNLASWHPKTASWGSYANDMQIAQMQRAFIFRVGRGGYSVVAHKTDALVIMMLWV